MHYTLTDAIGILGAILVLLAYFLVSTNRVPAKSRLFSSMNLVGSVCLFTNAYIGRHLPFMLLNGVWAIVAAYGILRTSRKH